ncbi:MAG: GAF domain-containing protein [Chloroflexi bacterium]|nr:GAF domain-containing protein [Chloroflexota bacterium]
MRPERISARTKWLIKWTSKWALAAFIVIIYLLSPSLHSQGQWIFLWLVVYLAYLVFLEVLSRTTSLYDTSIFRMVRPQAMAVLGSFLIILTGGASSPFWFVYLWSLFATFAFSEWVTEWVVWAEIAALYLLSSIVAAGAFGAIDWASLSTNLVLLFLLTVTFVESGRRYQTTGKSERYYEVLEQVQQDIDTAISVDQVLDRILRWAVRLVQARDGTLMLLDENGELRFRARFGRSLPEGKTERTFKLGEGIAGWVAQNRKPYVCHDARTDPHFVPIIAGFPIRSLVSVPIVSHGIVLGVINLDSKESNSFSTDDAQLLVTLASQTAAAIERAKLVEGLGEIATKTLGSSKDLYDYVVQTVNPCSHVAAGQKEQRERHDSCPQGVTRGICTCSRPEPRN